MRPLPSCKQYLHNQGLHTAKPLGHLDRSTAVDVATKPDTPHELGVSWVPTSEAQLSEHSSYWPVKGTSIDAQDHILQRLQLTSNKDTSRGRIACNAIFHNMSLLQALGTHSTLESVGLQVLIVAQTLPSLSFNVSQLGWAARNVILRHIASQPIREVQEPVV